MSPSAQPLNRIIEAIGALCLLVMLVLIVVLVTLRYVFNSGIVGANEAATICFIYASAFGAAVELGRREHIAVTALADKLDPARRRGAHIATFIALTIIHLVIAWESVRWISVTGGYLMPATQLPRAVAQFAVPLGCALATVYCALGTRATLRAGESP